MTTRSEVKNSVKGHNPQKIHLHPQGMCVCNIKTIQQTLFKISPGNITWTQGRTAERSNRLLTVFLTPLHRRGDEKRVKSIRQIRRPEPLAQAAHMCVH